MTVPSEREWGHTTAQLKELEHKVRNQKMILDGIVEESHELRSEIDRLRLQIKTVLTVLGAVITSLVWLVEVSLR
jgi:uncharacterized coiled-coil protein SlyX